MTPADELRALDDLALRLQGRFPGTPPEDLRRSVAEAHHQYDACRVRAFIPVLVEREVVDHYRGLAVRAVDAFDDVLDGPGAPAVVGPLPERARA